MNVRVPVISPSGKPLMPTKASRARRMVKEKKAVGKWNDVGVYYIQLKWTPKEINVQPIHLGCDPGKSYSGIGVQSSLNTLYQAPKGSSVPTSKRSFRGCCNQKRQSSKEYQGTCITKTCP